MQDLHMKWCITSFRVLLQKLCVLFPLLFRIQTFQTTVISSEGFKNGKIKFIQRSDESPETLRGLRERHCHRIVTSPLSQLIVEQRAEIQLLYESLIQRRIIVLLVIHGKQDENSSYISDQKTNEEQCKQ